MGAAPEVQHVGLVVAYTPGESITIADRDNDLYRFTLASPLKIVPPPRADQLGVGSFVTVIAPANEPNNKQTATGIVIHPSIPKGFPEIIEITITVWIDVTSSDDDVPGILELPTDDRRNVTFERIPQVPNPERTDDNLPYEEFAASDPLPVSAATIAADSVCFVVNDPDVVGPDPIRYCSISEPAAVIAFAGFTGLNASFPASLAIDTTDAPLSVVDGFPEQYNNLQDRMLAAADRIGYLSPIDTGQIISTIEDAQKLQDCANATEETRQALCSSDIIVMPVTPAYFLEMYENLLSMTFPLAAPTTLDVGIVKILIPIEVPTVNPAGSFTVQPGDYRLDYWFDLDGVFYASTLTGLAADDTPVVNLQAPALPALFIDAAGFQQPISQISACRIARWCLFEGGCR